MQGSERGEKGVRGGGGETIPSPIAGMREGRGDFPPICGPKSTWPPNCKWRNGVNAVAVKRREGGDSFPRCRRPSAVRVRPIERRGRTSSPVVISMNERRFSSPWYHWEATERRRRRSKSVLPSLSPDLDGKEEQGC